MSDLNEWIKERRRIHSAATEGSWRDHDCEPCASRGHEDLSIWSADDPVAQWLDSGNPNQRSDRDAIVDAHNSLPVLLTAVQKVLELHKPEAFEDEYSLQSGLMCESCYDPDKSEWVEWPCPTIRAIEGAVNDRHPRPRLHHLRTQDQRP